MIIKGSNYVDLRCSKTIPHQSTSYLNADLPLCAMRDLISEFPHQRVPANLSVKDRLPAKKQNHQSHGKQGRLNTLEMGRYTLKRKIKQTERKPVCL